MTRASKQSSTSPPPPPLIKPGQGGLVANPHANDVLCGRGGRINSHEGNVRFRDIVQALKPTYLNPATKKVEKAVIAAEVVQRIRNMDPPGRFLKEDDASGMWIDIGDERARKKAGQALREDAPDIRAEMTHPHEQHHGVGVGGVGQHQQHGGGTQNYGGQSQFNPAGTASPGPMSQGGFSPAGGFANQQQSPPGGFNNAGGYPEIAVNPSVMGGFSNIPEGMQPQQQQQVGGGQFYGGGQMNQGGMGNGNDQFYQQQLLQQQQQQQQQMNSPYNMGGGGQQGMMQPQGQFYQQGQQQQPLQQQQAAAQMGNNASMPPPQSQSPMPGSGGGGGGFSSRKKIMSKYFSGHELRNQHQHQQQKAKSSQVQPQQKQQEPSPTASSSSEDKLSSLPSLGGSIFGSTGSNGSSLSYLRGISFGSSITSSGLKGSGSESSPSSQQQQQKNSSSPKSSGGMRLPTHPEGGGSRSDSGSIPDTNVSGGGIRRLSPISSVADPEEAKSMAGSSSAGGGGQGGGGPPASDASGPSGANVKASGTSQFSIPLSAFDSVVSSGINHPGMKRSNSFPNLGSASDVDMLSITDSFWDDKQSIAGDGASMAGSVRSRGGRRIPLTFSLEPDNVPFEDQHKHAPPEPGSYARAIRANRMNQALNAQNASTAMSGVGMSGISMSGISQIAGSIASDDGSSSGQSASWLKPFKNMQTIGKEDGFNPWMAESTRSVLSDVSADLMALDLQSDSRMRHNYNF